MIHLAKIFLLVAAPALAVLLALLGLKTLSTNPLGWFLLLVGVIYTVGVVIAFYIRKKQFWESALKGTTTQEEQGDRSFWLITAGMMAAFYLPPIEYLYFAPVLTRTTWMSYSGAVIIILGISLFVWARRVLGTNYSGHVSVKEGQELVQNGPYRVLRHPAYMGYFLMALGIGLGYSSIAGLIVIFVLLLPVMVYRINLEEKMLAGHFREAYYEYARRTKRLVPGIW
jgi:protein-S-isoprenylcysteine O-methyltransferase Ste14